MYILSGDNWSDRVLDYSLGPGRVRIEVISWAVAGPVGGIYPEYPRDPAVIRAYLEEFGPGAVFRKVRSRLRERLRNDKYISIGLGRVISSGDQAARTDSETVIFVAPAHPRCLERIVLPTVLTIPAAPEIADRHRSSRGVRFYEAGPELPHQEEIAGWHPDSGRPLSEERIEKILSAAEDFWAGPVGRFRVLEVPRATVPATSSRAPRPAGPSDRLTAVLYGLGNYAKIYIIPGLDPGIRLTTIHEIDPTQITGRYRKCYNVSTDPLDAGDEKYDVCLIAGYHHTHAGLAIRALGGGAAAVVEKPLVTTREQLADLSGVLRRTRGRLYSCFQMRYNPLFELARRDLKLAPGEPLHITADVYEIPLPPRHWYTWPNSGSHLVSNGCHWLDHFLFMNDFSPPIRRAVSRAANGDTTATVELSNGACLFLHLTHLGSRRIGVRDYVAMRTGDRTVTVVDGSRYLAEEGWRKLRVKKINKMEVYRRMYREISRKIIAGEPGDSPESVEITCSLMLDLEEDLQHLHSGEMKAAEEYCVPERNGTSQVRTG